MSVSFLGQLAYPSTLKLPLFVSKVSATFPSPAQDYVEQTLDLNEAAQLSARQQLSSVRVEGESMIEAGIFHNDIWSSTARYSLCTAILWLLRWMAFYRERALFAAKADAAAA